MENPILCGGDWIFCVDIPVEITRKKRLFIHIVPLIPEILNISKSFHEDNVDKWDNILRRNFFIRAKAEVILVYP